MANDDRHGERRHALKLIIGAGGTAFACALAAPAAVFVAAPARAGATGDARWVRTVKLSALEDGVPKKVAIVSDRRDAWTVEKDVELGAAWLVRRGNEVRAWSVTCPHLGCAVNATTDGAFGCPCHTSAFDADGRRTAGPSPRDMDPLATKIEGGYVLVDFRMYRMGTAERVEVG